MSFDKEGQGLCDSLSPIEDRLGRVGSPDLGKSEHLRMYSNIRKLNFGVFS